uniref:hypothetical protein n=1 Tax=Polypodium hydriforme TaxID=43186 RepID=UPI002114DCC5|nr:hypothetical protein NQY43_mgp01 [Polypodium hydriforme]USZ79602.1 hypothetical protein [Polypodium hydriforme]
MLVVVYLFYFRSNVNRLVGYLAATWLLWLISIIVESGLGSSLHKLVVVFIFALGALCPAYFLAFVIFSILCGFVGSWLSCFFLYLFIWGLRFLVYISVGGLGLFFLFVYVYVFIFLLVIFRCIGFL